MTTSPTASEQLYGATWQFLERYLQVPVEPPELPGGAGHAESFRPHEAFLHYLHTVFWIIFGVIFLSGLFCLIILMTVEPIAGIIASILCLPIVIAIAIIVFASIRFRYDATWYVMSPGSLRIRRGIWVMRETTITFENVQNVRVERGPLQRVFGISSVVIETAGSGTARAGSGGLSNRAIIEGVRDAEMRRDIILRRWRASTSAGLGDDSHSPGKQRTRRPSLNWSDDHIAVLRDIHALLRAARSRQGG